MCQTKYARVLLTLAAIAVLAKYAHPAPLPLHQIPDEDGVYFVGPEVTAPRLLNTTDVLYPSNAPSKAILGMTVLAMVIDTNGIPAHIQVLHTHGEAFDQAAISAVKQSKFEPGKLRDHPVPVWIDVRTVFSAKRSQTVPEILITGRDLPLPDASKFEDKHHSPLSYTPPYPIHTVDADFADPFVLHPWVQVAIVSVMVGADGCLTMSTFGAASALVWTKKPKPPSGNIGFFPPQRKVRLLPHAQKSWSISPSSDR